jgi:protein SCO1
MRITNRSEHNGRTIARAALTVALLLAATVTLSAQNPPRFQDTIGFSPKLGDPLPLDLEFRDHEGRAVRLNGFFGQQPVILVPVYYRCPMLCGLELNGLVRCLRGLPLSPGTDFQIVTFSIDPRESSALAAQKRSTYLAEYGRDRGASGWQFLTGDQAAIDRLCEAIGFRAAYDQPSGQFAHAAGIVICTPDGRIARYFYGVEFAPRDLRLGLVEASRREIATLADQVQLFCYMYDPTTGRYGLAILALVRAGGVVTLLSLVTAIAWMLYRERRGGPAVQREAVRHG